MKEEQSANWEQIKYLRVPDEIVDVVKEHNTQQMAQYTRGRDTTRGRGDSRGRGRGRGGRGRGRG